MTLTNKQQKCYCLAKLIPMIILNLLSTVTKFSNAHHTEKPLGLFLDNKLDFNKHLDRKINPSRPDPRQ